jgi:hypothetical protein
MSISKKVYYFAESASLSGLSGLSLAKLTKTFQVDWQEQREMFGFTA